MCVLCMSYVSERVKKVDNGTEVDSLDEPE